MEEGVNRQIKSSLKSVLKSFFSATECYMDKVAFSGTTSGATLERYYKDVCRITKAASATLIVYKKYCKIPLRLTDVEVPLFASSSSSVFQWRATRIKSVKC